MASAAVVGALDPRNDRDPQLVTGRPGAPVENVVLQQREEALHGGVSPAAPTLLIEPDRPWRASAPIPAQRTACYAKADQLGAVVKREYVDAGESARSADRDDLQTTCQPSKWSSSSSS